MAGNVVQDVRRCQEDFDRYCDRKFLRSAATGCQWSPAEALSIAGFAINGSRRSWERQDLPAATGSWARRGSVREPYKVVFTIAVG